MVHLAWHRLNRWRDSILMTASIVLSWKWRKWDSNALRDYYHQSMDLLFVDWYSWKGIMDCYDWLYWAELKQYWIMGFPFLVTMMTYQYQWIMLEYGKAGSIRRYFGISSVLEVWTSESRGLGVSSTSESNSQPNTSTTISRKGA